MANVDELLKAYGVVKNNRSTYEDQIQKIANIIRPLKNEIQRTDTKGQNKRSRLYSGEPERANDRLGADLYSKMTNPSTQWFGLALEDKDLMRFGPVAEWLNIVNKQMHRSLQPQHSNFYGEMPGFFTDFSAFGTTFFWSERKAGTNRFIDRTRAWGEMYIASNAEGVVDQFYRHQGIQQLH